MSIMPLKLNSEDKALVQQSPLKLWNHFDKLDTYTEKLDLLKRVKRTSRGIFETLSYNISQNIRPKRENSLQQVDDILALAKVARTQNFLGTKLNHKNQDAVNLNALFRALTQIDIRPEHRDDTYADRVKTSLKRLASLRTLLAKETLQALSSKFRESSTLNFETEANRRIDADLQEYAFKQLKTMTEDFRSSGFANTKPVLRKSMEALSRFSEGLIQKPQI